MAEAFFPRLCGGTFFVLLTRAMKPHGRSHDTVRGISGITEAGLFKTLIRVYYPSMPTLAESTEKSNATNYKKCENPSQSTIPLTDETLINNYVRLVNSSYKTVLARMNSLVDEYIDYEGHGEWLVQALLQLIKEDESISADAVFRFLPDGHVVKNRDLDSTTTFYFQSFLLGVWTWIIQNRPDNTIGKETYLEWHPSARKSGKRNRHEFVSSIGNSTGRFVSVPLLSIEKDHSADAVLENPVHHLSEEYAEYLLSARHKFETIKTIMDEAPKPFYDFYVCNGLTLRRITALYADRERLEKSVSLFTRSMPDPTIDALKEISNFIIIEGTGGLGKSMMMRHLMMNTIDRVDFIGKLPIFVTLKDYNRSHLELTDFIFERFNILYPRADKHVFMTGLAKGAYVLLLDGLDEINSTFQGQFDRTLSSFVDTYPNNIVVMSSRPISKFTRFERFFEMALVPFSKSQALKLIDKLVFHPEEPEFKKKFRDAIEKRLYNSHREFAENPLLLTFMLMTFERFGEVPTQMHTFYGEVYDLLSKRHDASKVGFTRAYKTGLTPDRLKDIFAAFCANTYANQKYNLSHTEMEEYFRQIVCNSRIETERSIDPDDLIQDVTSGVCMMYEEGQEYHFMHRSFQEYFCALAFSKQMDEDLKRIGDFFEERGRNQRSDKAFNMLYDMIPDRVEKFIFVPFLEELLKEQNVSKGYWEFVRKVYPQIYYDVGEADSDSFTLPSSFLVDFLLEKAGLDDIIGADVLPFYEDLVEDEYIRVDLGDRTRVMDKKHVTRTVFSEEDEDEEFEDEIVGWTLTIGTEDLLEQKDRFRELIAAMESDDFLFKKQYEYLKHLLRELKEKHRKPKKDLISVI